MSENFPTYAEEAAYDRGFEHARDYWQPIIEAELIEKISSAEPSSFQNLAFDTGRIAEQARIIKLLEAKSASTELEGMESSNHYKQNAFMVANGLRMAIALIKGEQK